MAAAISSPLATRWIANSMLCARAASCSASSFARFGRFGIGKGRHPANSGHCFDQDFLSLAVKFDREDTDAGCIAAGPRQRGHQP